MFDQVVVRPRRRALKSVLIIGSAVAHAAVVATIAVAAMWEVDRVSLGPDRDDIAIAGPRPPMGAAALPAGTKLADPLKKPPKIKVTHVVQPPTVIPEPTPTAASGGGDPATTGTGGDGTSSIEGPPCPQEPCSEDGEPVKDDPPPVIQERIVVDDPPILPPTVAKGLRVSGDEQIFPGRTTQLAMVHDGKTQVRATFRLCVDEGGSVSSVKRLSGTGYGEYDEALMAGMRGWRYRPYFVARPGAAPVPTAMCTVQMFVYRIKD